MPRSATDQYFPSAKMLIINGSVTCQRYMIVHAENRTWDKALSHPSIHHSRTDSGYQLVPHPRNQGASICIESSLAHPLLLVWIGCMCGRWSWSIRNSTIGCAYCRRRRPVLINYNLATAAALQYNQGIR